MKTYYVYILASKSGTLYTGITSNLFRRVNEHKITSCRVLQISTMSIGCSIMKNTVHRLKRSKEKSRSNHGGGKRR
ncbi:MAG: GIY-YIG nuclease family protein [Planctomycetota bacterium]